MLGNLSSSNETCKSPVRQSSGALVDAIEGLYPIQLASLNPKVLKDCIDIFARPSLGNNISTTLASYVVTAVLAREIQKIQSYKMGLGVLEDTKLEHVPGGHSPRR